MDLAIGDEHSVGAGLLKSRRPWKASLRFASKKPLLRPLLLQHRFQMNSAGGDVEGLNPVGESFFWIEITWLPGVTAIVHGVEPTIASST